MATTPHPPLQDAYEEGTFPDMRTVFFGKGSGFRTGVTVPWVKLVDEYQVFLHLLGIEGEEHEGTWDRVKDMMA